MSAWIPSPLQLDAIWLGFRLGQLATLVCSGRCDFSHRNCFKIVCDHLTFRVTQLCFDPSSANEGIRELFRSLQTEWTDLPHALWTGFDSIKLSVKTRLEPLFQSTLEVLGAFGPEMEATFLLGWYLGLSERKWPDDGVGGQDDPRRYFMQVMASGGAVLPWRFSEYDSLRTCLRTFEIDEHFFDDDEYEESPYGPLWSHWSVIEDRILLLEDSSPYLGVRISAEGVLTRRGVLGERKVRESESRLLRIYLDAGKNWTPKADLVKQWGNISRRKALSPGGAIDQANSRLRQQLRALELFIATLEGPTRFRLEDLRHKKTKISEPTSE